MEKLVLFFGDSITDSGRNRDIPTSTGKGYATMASGQLSFENPGKYRFLNRGIMGNRVGDLLARVQMAVIPNKPDYISILIGVNDLFLEYSKKTTPGRKRFDAQYRMLLDEILEALPDTKIFLMAPFVLLGKETESSEANPGRFEFLRGEIPYREEIVRKIAEDYNLPFISLQDKFDAATEGMPNTLWLKDGVHPSNAGHYLIAQEWLRTFREMTKNED